MQGVHTVEEVRAAEDAVMSRLEPDTLMLRAASALARTCAQLLMSHVGGVYGARVVLLVGTGNNGGDALFAGALLSRRGAAVLVIAAGAGIHEGGALAAERAGCRLCSLDDAAQAIGAADLIVDGLLGIGGKGGLREPAAMLAEQATLSDAIVVAVDLPSGVDADTGRAGDDAVWADVTVTFGLMKPGLLLHPGAMHAGVVERIDLGLEDDAVVPSITCLEAPDVAALLPHPAPLDHKYSQGVVGVAAGSGQYPGAAVLTVGGALRAKAGLVRYVGASHRDVVTAWPSAIVSDESIPAAGRVQTWAVGPGLGTDEPARKKLTDVLTEPVPVVVDADALTMVASTPDLVHVRVAATVLTPHATEFARLAPDLDVASDPLAAVRTLAARLECTVLLKGATTIVADADGQVRLNVTGTPWLATAGSGDVLTGVLGAYLAAGLTAFDAASVAAFVHGLAGRVAATGAPITSFDVIAAMPDAIRAVTRP